ncbi:sensor domain-containing protein [Xanthomonas prunicola]|uniref:Sensor domain-containing protein n=1 Tax=Xanthomonas prunicola TaxID=2053930 RepID=A0A9Q9MQG6_9XANT|nr:sensor domain-containing protein [Xanthomonas prunicola]USJ01168.1 sensor domain-containing protein [Xanthomonas prunicola]UXA49696.1 sensor domain-containing protein [Xanthomonas prunicola]UXA57993.1 sensor domain-containing protein [Xanthomonas prunicola]UXA60144.1 sensor domain-containing protein [Xanthomonas prunicola]UXA66207.1 sensor domain-containing protein [Xanthomonas prunicola]
MNTMTQAHPLPTTIPDYLLQLRQALSGADPAMIQDALYDAEEYLRAELAEQKGKNEAEVIAGVASSYGAPEEVAEIYRETEVTVTRALRPPVPPKRASWIGAFFGVAADPRTYGALFYMLLSLLTGIFYFTWVVAGASLSIGLMILIIGVPLLVLFFGSVRVLSLVEGRLVETLLGVRMPRRPPHPGLQGGWLQRIGAMFTDVRTWSTMVYFLLMLPLGVIYFTVFCTLLSLSLGLAASPLALLFDNAAVLTWDGVDITSGWLTLPLFLVGVLLLFVTLHVARAFGKLHGMFAKQLLVKSGEAAA